MKTIAFFNIPAYGHIRPTLPVVEELVKKGTRVLYFIDEAHRNAVAETGAEVRLTPNLTGLPSELPSSAMDFAAQLVKQARHIIPDLVKEIQAEEDVGLIVHDSVCCWGRLVAEETGLPSARTCPIFMGLGPPWQGGRMTAMLLREGFDSFFDFIPFRKERRKFIDRFHKNLRFHHFLDNKAELSIVFTSREFVPNPENIDGETCFIGSSFSDSVKGDFELPDLSGQRLIYVSLGTTFTDAAAFYQTCKEAFGSMDCKVLMSVGRKFDPRELDPLPDNFVVAPFVPQVDVLRQASVFLMQAGGSSVMESLWHGVPMVMWPLISDHLFNAQCVVRHGAGVLLRKRDLTPERLGAIVHTVGTDPSYRLAAERMGDTFRAGGGPQRAAEALLKFRDEKQALLGEPS